MKRIVLLVCLLTAGLFLAKAQEKPDATKMAQERISYMKENLKLNSTEAQKFWTAYEQYVKSEINYHNSFRNNLSKQGIKAHCPSCANSQQDLTDKQISYMYDQRMELKKNLFTLESNFYKKIKGILTPKHIQEFYRLEDKYKREVVSKKKTVTKNQQSTSTSSSTPNKKRR